VLRAPVTTVARLVLDVPLDRPFDYRLEDPTPEPECGRLAVVPFGNRTAVGVIVGIAADSDVDPAQMKSVMRVLCDAPRVAPDDLRLLRFASDYYHYPLGQAVLGALPLRLRKPPSETPPRARQSRASPVRPPGEPSAVHAPSPDQRAAVAAIRGKSDRFAAFLLLGVTGSGKTEVYLRLTDDALTRGAQVLMLVPEIALTPQLEAMGRRAFRERGS
jgi:primosomal protein N' (replication factor Y)